MKAEEWRNIDGYYGYYQISNYGRVRALPRFTLVRQVNRKGHVHDETWERKGKILKATVVKGQAYVHLHKEGQPIRFVAIKRLVAEHFLPDFDRTISTRRVRIENNSDRCFADNLRVKSL